jgi:transcriptional regulator with XRE-family HTH domain
MNDVLKYIGGKIREIRNKQGISIEELAGKSDLTKTYLAQMERGEVNFSIKKLEGVCNSLHIELSDLFQLDQTIITKINSSPSKESIYEIVEFCITTQNGRDIELILGLIRAMK